VSTVGYTALECNRASDPQTTNSKPARPSVSILGQTRYLPEAPAHDPGRSHIHRSRTTRIPVRQTTQLTPASPAGNLPAAGGSSGCADLQRPNHPNHHFIRPRARAFRVVTGVLRRSSAILASDLIAEQGTAKPSMPVTKPVLDSYELNPPGPVERCSSHTGDHLSRGHFPHVLPAAGRLGLYSRQIARALIRCAQLSRLSAGINAGDVARRSEVLPFALSQLTPHRHGSVDTGVGEPSQGREMMWTLGRTTRALPVPGPPRRWSVSSQLGRKGCVPAPGGLPRYPTASDLPDNGKPAVPSRCRPALRDQTAAAVALDDTCTMRPHSTAPTTHFGGGGGRVTGKNHMRKRHNG